jgi:hypothetical protein
MSRLLDACRRLGPERLAELVSSAAYGSVLVLAAIGVTEVSDVARGHSAELVAGVGLATFVAHVFAEILGGHVRHPEPLRRAELGRAVVDGCPILAATVLPAAVLVPASLEAVDTGAALTAALGLALVQLVLIGILVARVTPARRSDVWSFAAVTGGIGLAIAALTVWLGH